MEKLNFGKKIAVLLLALFAITNTYAQIGLKLEVSSHSIGKDEVLQVAYSLQNATEINSNLSIRNFPGWKIVSGPQTSQETSIVNGNRSSSISYIYLLMPEKIGTLTVPGATITADGKQLSCPGATILVKNHSSGNANPPSSGNNSGMAGLQSLLDQFSNGGDQQETGNVLHRGENALQKIKDNMFVRATPSKKTVYVGEPFYVTYQLFSALGGQSKVTGQPSFTGVSVVDLTREEAEPEVVTIGNKKYRSFLIRRVQLTALRAGAISLGTIETSNAIPFTAYDDPYHTETYTQTIQNPNVTVEAKELPTAGKPADFSGSIGKFQIHVVPQHISSPAGENNSLHIEITGEGNLLPATIPNIVWPAGVDHYDPKDSQNVDKRSFPVAVSKVFEVPFIGQKQGKATFAPISFTYFDPSTATYKTIQSDPFTVEFTAPLAHATNSDNSFGTTVVNVAKVVGGLAICILVFTVGFKTIKKGKKKTPAIVDDKKIEEAAPWNIDDRKKEQIPPIQKEETNAPQPIESKEIAEETPKKNFKIELQKIMLVSNKSEMYELGSSTMKDILATYLNAPNLSKDQLLSQLSQTTKPEKEDVIKTVNDLQAQLNKGLYSPLFTEADKLSLIDGLSELLDKTGL